jgi:hypothetical protein
MKVKLSWADNTTINYWRVVRKAAMMEDGALELLVSSWQLCYFHSA